MRKFLVSLVVVLVATAGAQAGLLVNETFTHPNGDLVGQVPELGTAWGTHSGTIGPVQVSGGQALVVQANTQDVNVGTGSALAAGQRWYAGFDLTNTGGNANVYFAHFLMGTSSFTSRIWVTAPASGGDYRLVITNGSTITAGAYSGDLLYGTKYRIVNYYDYDAAQGKLWIDPVDESSPGFLATDAVTFHNAVTAYAFRQGGGTSTQAVDNLLVGTTFNDVLPEPATLALVAFGALALLRRR